MTKAQLTADELEHQRVLFERARLADHPSPCLDRSETGEYLAIHTWVAWRYWVKAVETNK